jgi:hypothetical protein
LTTSADSILTKNSYRIDLPVLLLKFSAGQLNTLVNFESALLRLHGQFSVGVNTIVYKCFRLCRPGQSKVGILAKSASASTDLGQAVSGLSQKADFG